MIKQIEKKSNDVNRRSRRGEEKEEIQPKQNCIFVLWRLPECIKQETKQSEKSYRYMLFL